MRWSGSAGSCFVDDLGLSPYPSASEPRVLIAVSPTIHCTLNQSALATQTGIQFCQSPSHLVALRFVIQAVTLVLISRNARPWIDTILGFELLGQAGGIHRLDVASDGVFHLDTVARILKSNPLDTIVVLTNNQRRSRRNWARCCIRPAGRHVVLRRPNTRRSWCRSGSRMLLVHQARALLWSL